MPVFQKYGGLRRFGVATLAVIGVLGLSGFSVQKVDNLPPPDALGQPADERAAQDTLPKSHDTMWNSFAKCKVKLNEDDAHDIYEYNITYTPEVKAMEGKTITISGFMLPLESSEKFKHFILSKRTPTCPFCPPGEPNEIVDVWTKNPVKWDEGLVKVTGKFGFTKQKELGMFFKLSDAKMEK